MALHGRSRLRSALFCAVIAGSSPGLASWSIENDRSTPEKHGLFEIREEVRRFISRENDNALLQWEVLELNPKTLVPRCAVALTVEWTPKEAGRSSPSVTAICKVAVPNSAMGSWQVHVPVIAPNARSRGKIEGVAPYDGTGALPHKAVVDKNDR